MEAGRSKVPTCRRGQQCYTCPSAFRRTPTLQMPGAGLPVNRIRVFTKVDQHVQMSQSILVLEENKPKSTIKHHHLITRSTPNMGICKASRPVVPKNSLAVQWLGLHTFTAEGPDSIPGWGAKIPQAAWCSQNKRKKNYTNGS